jgi:hypothetical protein
MEESYAGKARCLEGDAEPDTGVATLNFPHRGDTYPRALRKLLQGPASFPAAETDPVPQQACSLKGAGRKGSVMPHMEIIVSLSYQ